MEDGAIPEQLSEFMLDDGQIVGKGTHKELLKNCEAYYQIASSQLSENELEEDLKEVELYAKR